MVAAAAALEEEESKAQANLEETAVAPEQGGVDSAGYRRYSLWYYYFDTVIIWCTFGCT